MGVISMARAIRSAWTGSDGDDVLPDERDSTLTYQRSQGLTVSASCEMQDFLYVPILSVQ